MDEICRLCLSESMKMTSILSDELKILQRLSYLNIQIHINDSLPSCICHMCFKTLEDIEIFREKISQSEDKLKQHLKDKTLDVFYQIINNEKVSIENVKIEPGDGCDDTFCDESAYFNTEDQTKISKKKGIHKNVTQVLTTKNVIVENNISNVKTDKPENENPKRKSQVEVKEPAKSKCVNSKATLNSVEINHSKGITEKILGDISESNTSKLEPNESEPKIIEIENSVETKNGDIDIKIEEHKCLTCFRYLLSHSELIKHYKSVHLYNTENYSKSQRTQNTLEAKALNDNDNKIEAGNDATHKSERPYNCKICGRTFTSVYGIVRHGRAHSARPLYCSNGCGYSTVYGAALSNHEKRHEKNFKYKCGTCGAGFHVRTWLDQHQNLHRNVKPFVCDVCGMAFHMHRYMTSHRSAVHADITKGASRFVCSHCDHPFHNVHSYKAHLEEHTGKRSFLCEQCGKACASAEQLKYHKNSHSGIKPYSCSICNKRFSKKFNVTVHERAHAGEKHLCQACGKYFAQRSTLLRHHRKRHPDVTEDNAENRKEST